MINHSHVFISIDCCIVPITDSVFTAIPEHASVGGSLISRTKIRAAEGELTVLDALVYLLKDFVSSKSIVTVVLFEKKYLICTEELWSELHRITVNQDVEFGAAAGVLVACACNLTSAVLGRRSDSRFRCRDILVMLCLNVTPA